jgi:hypothetical protein
VNHELPPLYQRWVSGLLTGPIPKENLATCSSCAMCIQPDGALPNSIYVFDPNLKCCVYMPILPNFLAGRILADVGHPEGVRTVRERIRAGIAVTPLGIGRPPSYDLLFRNSASSLGRSRALKCPHYLDDSGMCAIWSHRDATCTTWFCRHNRGKIGGDFWRSIRELLEMVEGTLGRWCALEMGIDPERIAAYLAREGHGPPGWIPNGFEVDGQADETRRREDWGEWLDREEAFYLACAEKVEALAWPDIAAIAGPELRILAEVARRHHDRLLSDLIPGRLRVGQFQVHAHRDGGLRVFSYSHTDAIDLPTPLLPLLPRFDGRPTVDVLQELASEGVGLQADFLRQLVDWGVLVAA